LSGAYSLARAGHWFLHSGIQDQAGGVARFYRADLQKNKPVSTEITGYTASALVFLYRVTGEEEYLDRARLTARFLCDHAWDDALRTFPFEHPSPSGASEHHSYFFDCGIIVRGLISVWRVTREDRLLDMAVAASRGMIADFHSGADYHPILELPEKSALARADQWSRMPGCYQTKSALAWWEVAEATGETALREAYLEMLDAGLRTYRDFLPGASDRTRVMDRLHAYCYFLEAMYPVLDRADCVEAYGYTLAAVSRYLRDIAPEFARSDVYAQLLRARVYGAGAVSVDVAAGQEEAAALAEFQVHGDDVRTDGAFLFGCRHGELAPHANPVSTAFAIQALEAWRAFGNGEENPCHLPPI
jgi:hypothetical protein